MSSAEPRTFRATTEAWLGQLLLPLSFFVMLTITAVNLAGLSPVVGGLGIGFLALIVAMDYLIPMVRNWLYLDSISIEGSLNGSYFQVYWHEVKATWLYEHQRRRFLCLGTREGTLVIPLRFFDECSLWEQVRGAVPPSALEDSAIERLPDYRDWETARQTFLDNPTPRRVADHWLLQVIGWSGVVFFLLGLVGAMQARNLGQAAVYSALVIASGALPLGWGVSEIGPEQVRRFTVFGRWAMPWEEVRWIEIDLFESVIVLVGENRRLVIPGPGIWNGAGKREALAQILAQAERRCIQLRRAPLAFLKVSRNTRMKKQRENQS